MADTTFVDFSPPAINAAWLNDVNTAVYKVSGLLKGNGTIVSAAVANVDYATSKYYNSNTTNALNYTNGINQRWAPAVGAQTLSITSWPAAGNLAILLIEGVNLGASTITWPTINWIQPSGAMTTSFNTYLASLSRTLQTSGIDFVTIWTRDAGTTLYGKLV